MSKYIIELDDRIKLVTSVGVTENGVVYTTSDYVHNLEELNSDYINEHFGSLQDEAYQRGHDDGYEAGCATAFKPVSDAEYQHGLDDAWEAAKKLFSSMADSDIEKAFPIEWNNGGFKALMNLQPQEAIAKLKAYEDKQKDRIEVGDEVKYHFEGYGVVTRIKEVNGNTHYNAVWSSGNTGYYDPDDLTKTGKHYDIQSILEAMKS